jgi:hypothetical protein
MASIARISQLGLSIGLPTGWDGGIYRRQAVADATTHPVVHASTVPLSPVRGDFGGGAVERLGVDDVFIALLEYDPADAGRALYRATGGVPGVTADLFSPVALQRLIAPQAGCQQFFTVVGRAFCLYVVIGNYANRYRLAALANSVLSGLQIQPLGTP